MASVGHLWRATRVNTRKNSTRASVAHVLNAERVRAAHSAAATAGVSSTALDYVGAGAVPRARRVVAFDESVTVHYLPPDDYEDEPSHEEGICTTCQAPIDDERRRRRRAWGLLRQVDELDTRRGVCRCDGSERSRYPEYSVDGDEVVVDDDDEEDEDAETATDNAEKEQRPERRPSTDGRRVRSSGDARRFSAGPPDIALAGSKVPLAQDPTLAAQAQTGPPRERALRFSRSRKKAPSVEPPTVSKSASKSGDGATVGLAASADAVMEDASGGDTESDKNSRSQRLSDDSVIADMSMNGLPRRDSSPVPTPFLADPDSPEAVKPVKSHALVTSKSQPGRMQTPSPPRISATLSDIRRRMVNEMTEDDAQAAVVAGRRSRTLPPPGHRAASRPSFVRLSSMSDIEPGLERDTKTASGGEAALARIAAADESERAKQLSQLTPTHGSPSDGGGSRTDLRNLSEDEVIRRSSRVDPPAGPPANFALLPPAATPANVQPLSPASLARLRAGTSDQEKEASIVGAPSTHIAIESALSAASAPVMGPEHGDAPGRLRFRGRRARAAAAAALASRLAAATEQVPEQSRTLRRSTARERSFAGFCARDTSVISGAGTRFEERREEFSARHLHGAPAAIGQGGVPSLMKSFHRRTDLLAADREQRPAAPRKKAAPLRGLRVRVSRLMRGSKANNGSAGGDEEPTAVLTVAEKLSRQMCIKHDAY